ncbi:uncharacterized protein LOC121858912 [Homarus americanus]|uniref:uncharacterized protein LOC121858912 n=1 Tax=Homarus americanus TaxID=6706 RepID=UPI001C495B51|nr:uncharacterized protein LOC121858912 [Homarus americanus]
MSLWCSSRWPSPLAADSRRDIIRDWLLLVCLNDLDAHTNLTSHRTILMGWGTGEGMIAVVRTINGSACSQRYEGRNVGISVSSLCAAPVSATQQDFCKCLKWWNCVADLGQRKCSTVLCSLRTS